MNFSDTSNETGIVQEVRRITQSTANSYPLKDIARRVNMALDRFFTLAFQSDGRWNFDDLNQTSAPIQSINLVSGTSRYALDTFASEIINVLRVEIKDSTSNGLPLNPISLDGIKIDYDEFAETSGLPRGYLKIGKYIDLKPAPNYSSTNGLTLYFERNKVAMLYSDTTAAPGIPSIFHPYICKKTAISYFNDNSKPVPAWLSKEVNEDEEAIIAHFGRREKDLGQVKIQPKRNWRKF